MTSFSTDLDKLHGLELDLADAAGNLTVNANRLAHAVTLQDAYRGDLLSTVEAALDAFASQYFADIRVNSDSIRYIGTSSGRAARSYDGHEEGNAAMLSAVGYDSRFASAAPDPVPQSIGSQRYSDIQLPSLQSEQPESFELRKLISECAEVIGAMEDALSQSVGLRPVADYLDPLRADWEILRTVGIAIRRLGTNDYVAGENLAGTTRWIGETWSGAAARSFHEAMLPLQQSLLGRSEYADRVGLLVERAGEFLERVVLNQAMSLYGGLMKPTTRHAGTFPLGIWATTEYGSLAGDDCAAEIDAIRRGADQRQASIDDALTRIRSALDYDPQKPVADISTSFELPARVLVDQGALRFGFDDAVWVQCASPEFRVDAS